MRQSRIALAILAGVAAAATANAELVRGVTQTGFLVTWDSASPNDILAGVALQGMQTNETIVGIDYRPATGELFGLGSFSRLYTINAGTGVATQVGAGPFIPTLNGSSFGFDFNPTVDRIRVVSEQDQNLRLHPVTGAVAAVDTNLSYAAGDPNFGVDPNVNGSAYTNSFPGATSTTLYGIDTGLDTLVIQNANPGLLTTVGGLGQNFTAITGFDISGATGIAYFAGRVNAENRSTFWTVNLATGAATFVGEIDGGVIITAMAVVPTPGAAGLFAVAGLAAIRRRR